MKDDVEIRLQDVNSTLDGWIEKESRRSIWAEETASHLGYVARDTASARKAAVLYSCITRNDKRQIVLEI